MTIRTWEERCEEYGEDVYVTGQMVSDAKTEEITELRAEVKRLEVYQHELNNLLAIIHKDGGENAFTYGPVSSTEQAISVVCNLRVRLAK